MPPGPQRYPIRALTFGCTDIREDLDDDLLGPCEPAAAVLVPRGRQRSLRNEERRHREHCRHAAEPLRHALHTALLLTGIAGESWEGALECRGSVRAGEILTVAIPAVARNEELAGAPRER